MSKVPTKLALTFLSMFSYAVGAQANCTVANVMESLDDATRKGLRVGGKDWLAHAKVCTLGPYRIFVPADPEKAAETPLLVLKDGKPLFERDKGSTLVFNPNTKSAKTALPLVTLWHGKSDRDIERLWYQTPPDADDESIMLYDLDFDGQPDQRTRWKGNNIVELSIWYQERWHIVRNKCITVDGRCVPVTFENGRWRLKDQD